MLATSGKWVRGLARLVSILGGIVLAAVAVMTAISIFGRAFLQFGLKPIPGDFELVEAGVAFVVCAFLPWGHLMRGHASVNIVTDFLGERANLIIDLIADALLLLAAIVMTWRHFYGLLDKKAYGETTFILQYPLWWAYAACMVGLIAWIIVGVWTVFSDINSLSGGEGHGGEGAVH